MFNIMSSYFRMINHIVRYKLLYMFVDILDIWSVGLAGESWGMWYSSGY